MPSPMTFRPISNSERKLRVAKSSTAREAIGTIAKGSDTYILTFGQFSLIDALVTILDQTGPADVTISTWTAADAHLQRSSALIESANITRLRMILDRSFQFRQPDYCHHMFRLFGADCIRFTKSHAKFMLIRSATHDVVVRTSMNLNENPRLENIEIAENRSFAEFFTQMVDSIFAELDPKDAKEAMLRLDEIPDSYPFQEIDAPAIQRDTLREPETTHTIRRH